MGFECGHVNSTNGAQVNCTGKAQEQVISRTTFQRVLLGLGEGARKLWPIMLVRQIWDSVKSIRGAGLEAEAGMSRRISPFVSYASPIQTLSAILKSGHVMWPANRGGRVVQGTLLSLEAEEFKRARNRSTSIFYQPLPKCYFETQSHAEFALVRMFSVLCYYLSLTPYTGTRCRWSPCRI
jgi:hypothetical protein